jgi:hypothetical protein
MYLLTPRYIAVEANNYLLPLKGEGYQLTWAQESRLNSMFRIESAPIFHELNSPAWWRDHFIVMPHKQLCNTVKGLGLTPEHKTKVYLAEFLAKYFYQLVESFKSNPTTIEKEAVNDEG